MRGFAAFVAGAIAILAFAIALPATWVAQNISDEDGYVALSRDVLSDDNIRESVVTEVVNQLNGYTQSQLSDLGVPSYIIDQSLALVSKLVTDGLADDAVLDAWASAQRSAHQQMFAGNDRGFIIELSPLIGSAAQAAGLDVSVPAGVTVETTSPQVRDLVALAERAPTAQWVAWSVLVVAVVASVAVARNRHRPLLVLGVLGVLMVGLEYATISAFDLRDVANLSGRADTMPERVLVAVSDYAADSYGDLLLRVGLGAVGLLIIGVLVTIFRRRSAPTYI